MGAMAGTIDIQSGRTCQILQEFVFSPEITCNRKMTRVRRRSVSKRYFLSAIQNVFGEGLVVPEG